MSSADASGAALAVIGGSGLYRMKDVDIIEEKVVQTPFGEPSDAVMVAELNGQKLLFLPRHGRGHRIMPGEINYRANICALKMLGARRIVSISAVGSMREDFHPGEIVIVDQFFDRTWGRRGTFFGEGLVGHVPFADPVCNEMAAKLYASAQELGIKSHMGGTYICIQGPTFSTRAESRIFRQWGVDVIGMTNLPEARLAREAEMCYATMALVTDYDCWRTEEDDVSVESIVETLKKNVSNAQEILRHAAENIMKNDDCECHRALEGVILSDMALVDRKTKQRLKPIAGRVIK